MGIGPRDEEEAVFMSDTLRSLVLDDLTIRAKSGLLVEPEGT